MPAVRHGFRQNGGRSAATSSSCWAAGIGNGGDSQLCVAAVNGRHADVAFADAAMCLAGLHGKYLVVAKRAVIASGLSMWCWRALGSNTEYAVYRRKHGEKAAWSHRGGPECGSSVRCRRNRRQWQLRERMAGAAGDLRQGTSIRRRR